MKGNAALSLWSDEAARSRRQGWEGEDLAFGLVQRQTEGRHQRLRGTVRSELAAGDRRLQSGPFQSSAELRRAFEP
jgi:hypothetical protein